MMGAERAAAAVKKLTTALEKYKFILLVLAAGLLLLLLPTSPGGGAQSATTESGSVAEFAFSVDELEEKLEATLSKIDGAGEVTVALTLRTGARQVLAQDVAVSDRDGDSSEERTTVLISGVSGRE